MWSLKSTGLLPPIYSTKQTNYTNADCFVVQGGGTTDVIPNRLLIKLDVALKESQINYTRLCSSRNDLWLVVVAVRVSKSLRIFQIPFPGNVSGHNMGVTQAFIFFYSQHDVKGMVMYCTPSHKVKFLSLSLFRHTLRFDWQPLQNGCKTPTNVTRKHSRHLGIYFTWL